MILIFSYTICRLRMQADTLSLSFFLSVLDFLLFTLFEGKFIFLVIRPCHKSLLWHIRVDVFLHTSFCVGWWWIDMGWNVKMLSWFIFFACWGWVWLALIRYVDVFCVPFSLRVAADQTFSGLMKKLCEVCEKTFFFSATFIYCHEILWSSKKIMKEILRLSYIYIYIYKNQPYSK